MFLRRFAKWLILVIPLGAAICYFWQAPAPPVHLPRPERTDLRPRGPIDQPEIELTADHRLARIRHKDAHGNSPLELVETPQGTVRIQRTFDDKGVVLKEEAFLNGERVPVPKGEARGVKN